MFVRGLNTFKDSLSIFAKIANCEEMGFVTGFFGKVRTSGNLKDLQRTMEKNGSLIFYSGTGYYYQEGRKFECPGFDFKSLASTIQSEAFSEISSSTAVADQRRRPGRDANLAALTDSRDISSVEEPEMQFNFTQITARCYLPTPRFDRPAVSQLVDIPSPASLTFTHSLNNVIPSPILPSTQRQPAQEELPGLPWDSTIETLSPVLVNDLDENSASNNFFSNASDNDLYDHSFDYIVPSTPPTALEIPLTAPDSVFSAFFPSQAESTTLNTPASLEVSYQGPIFDEAVDLHGYEDERQVITDPIPQLHTVTVTRPAKRRALQR